MTGVEANAVPGRGGPPAADGPPPTPSPPSLTWWELPSEQKLAVITDTFAYATRRVGPDEHIPPVPPDLEDAARARHGRIVHSHP